MPGTGSAFPKFVQSHASNMMRSSMYPSKAMGSKYGGSVGKSSISPNTQNKSSMIEQEMKAIRKIKEKQKKEIE